MKKHLKCLFLYFIFYFSLSFALAQKSAVLTGTVYDKSNNSAIPYSNIYLKYSKSGTISQNDGTFTLSIPRLPDTLIISAIGYETRKIQLTAKNSKTLNIGLASSDFELGEIVIHPSENPALRIMRNVIKRKDRNDPEKANTLACNTYTKLLFKTKGNVEGDSTLEKGLPVYFSEKVSQNIIQRKPYYERGKIIAEHQEGLGLFREINVAGYANNLGIEFNFFKNVIDFFDKPFISPLHTNAFIYYNFHLADSIQSDLGKEYIIEFAPRNTKDPAFKGVMSVLDEDWFLTEITTKIPVSANLNYVNKIDLHQTFTPINDSMVYLNVNEINAELKITKDNSLIDINFTGVMNKRSVYSDVILNFPPIKPGEEEAIWSTINPLKKESIKTGVISEIRPEELSGRELQAISVIDSMNNDWRIKTVDNLTRMFLTGYIPGDYLEMGPYLELIKHNKVEGYRFNLSGRTSSKFTKNKMFYGHVGYGTLDREWKFGAGFKYKFPTGRRRILTLDYRNDYSKIGDNGSIFLIKENMMVTGEDNIITALFTNKPLEQLSREVSYRAEYDHEWRPGLTNIISYKHRTIYPGKYVPFEINNIPVSHIRTDELTLRLRLTREERYTDDYCRRYYLNSIYPRFNFLITGGHYTAGEKSGNYLNARAVIRHDISLGLTKFYYIFESGITLGKVPFPLLETHRTDQSLGYAIYSFNMMNELEFASDRFVSILAQYHLNGLFFNRVPLLKRLGFREVFSAKVLWSHLGNEHKEILDFRHDYHDARIPYVELSAGVENILQYLRADIVWRLSQLDTPGVRSIAFRFRFDVSF